MNAAAITEVRETLLANSRRINAREAAIRILSERGKCERDVAQLRLDQIRRAEEVAQLFERVMPAEYKRTLAKCKGSRLDAAHAFVPQLGFPVYDAWNPLNYDALREIPMEPMGFHVCDGCYDFVSFKLEYQLGLLILPVLHEDEIFYMDEEEQEAYIADRHDSLNRNWTYFASKHDLDNRLRPDGSAALDDLYVEFSKSRTPLRFFTEMWSFIRHSTGSLFLDTDGDDYAPDIPWSRQAIIDLRGEYALAQRIMADIEELGRWLKTDPSTRVHQALRLYARARKITDDKPKRRRKSAALVRIL